MIIITLSPCVSGDRPSSGSYKVVTPFALSDTPLGALGGNGIVFSSLLLVQVLFLGYQIIFQKVPLVTAMANARLPSFSILIAASLYQSTLFVALRILFLETSVGAGGTVVGVSALLAALLFPVGSYVAVKKLPRYFVQYNILQTSRFSRIPTRVASVILPVGVTLPRSLRLMASSLVTGYRVPDAYCVLIPFASALIVNFVAVFPPSTSPELCKVLLLVSAVSHLVMGGIVLHVQMYRIALSGHLASVGLFFVAVLQIQLAVGEAQGDLGVRTVITLQVVLSFVRCFVGIGTSVLENKMIGDPSILSNHVMWIIGSPSMEEIGEDAAAVTTLSKMMMLDQDEEMPIKTRNRKVKEPQAPYRRHEAEEEQTAKNDIKYTSSAEVLWPTAEPVQEQHKQQFDSPPVSRTALSPSTAAADMATTKKNKIAATRPPRRSVHILRAEQELLVTSAAHFQCPCEDRLPLLVEASCLTAVIASSRQ